MGKYRRCLSHHFTYKVFKAQSNMFGISWFTTKIWKKDLEPYLTAQHEFVRTEPAAGKSKQVLAAKFGGENCFSFPVRFNPFIYFWFRGIFMVSVQVKENEEMKKGKKKENLRTVLNCV